MSLYNYPKIPLEYLDIEVGFSKKSGQHSNYSDKCSNSVLLTHSPCFAKSTAIAYKFDNSKQNSCFGPSLPN